MANTLRLTEAELDAIKRRQAEISGRLDRGPITGLKPIPVIPKGSNKVEGSRLETMFALQLRAIGAPPWVEQYVGAVPGRKYRLDFAFPERKICVECVGHVHRIKKRFLADCERTCLLVLEGWRVLPVSGDDIRSGRAAGWIAKLLAGR